MALGLAGLSLGAGVGYYSGMPVYRSAGLLRPVSDGVTTAGATESGGAAIGGQDVLTHAVASLDIAAMGWLSPQEAQRQIQHRLEVAPSDQGPGLVEVAYTAADASSAAQVVQAVMNAYVQITRDRLRAHEQQQREAAQQQLAVHQQQLDQATAKARGIGQSVAPFAVQQVYDAKAAQVTKLAALLEETRGAMATAQALIITQAGTSPLLPPARSDPQLEQLLSRKADLERMLWGLQSRMGPNAPAVQSLRDELDWTDRQVGGYTLSSSLVPLNMPPLSPIGDGSPQPVTFDDLRARLDKLQRLHGQAQARLTELAATLGQERELAAQAASWLQRRDQAQARVDELAVQSSAQRQAAIAEPAAVPMSPARDARGSNATIGGALGLALGLSLALAFVLLDDRMLRSDATQWSGAVPLLGAVPKVEMTDPSQDESNLTALAIHEIRALLQARASRHGAQAFAITSPGKGSGKTSLTAGLASSLAMSGTRTLLVDCDLVNRVMGAGAPAAASSVQAPTVPITGEPSPQSRTQRPGEQRLDSVMVEMGYLSQHNTELFMAPHDTEVGLRGLLDGQPLDHCVVETSVPGLSILPALAMQGSDIGRLSNRFISRLIEQAKLQYDMILFDTGPIPGSVEALYVAGEVDAVVLVVSRGETQTNFNRAVSYLKMVGATLAGTVFNRADRADMTLHVPAGAGGKRARKTGKTSAADLAARRIRMSRGTGSGLLAAAVDAYSRPAGRAPSATEPQTEMEDIDVSSVFGMVRETSSETPAGLFAGDETDEASKPVARDVPGDESTKQPASDAGEQQEGNKPSPLAWDQLSGYRPRPPARE